MLLFLFCFVLKHSLCLLLKGTCRQHVSICFRWCVRLCKTKHAVSRSESSDFRGRMKIHPKKKFFAGSKWSTLTNGVLIALLCFYHLSRTSFQLEGSCFLLTEMGVPSFKGYARCLRKEALLLKGFRFTYKTSSSQVCKGQRGHRKP